MADSPDSEPKKRRLWRGISLRAMLLLVLAAGAPMGWWARRAQLQRAAVARIEAAGGGVFYAFEILDADGGASPEATERVTRAAARVGHVNWFVAPSPIPPPVQPWKDRLRRAFGVDFVDSVVQIIALETDKLENDNLSFLNDLPRVECINLGRSPIGDRAMEQISGLRDLKTLYLSGEDLTDAGLARLAGLDRLETLGILDAGPKVTDAGLRSLEGLTNLKILMIDGPNISEQALERLSLALPNAKIPAKARSRSIEGQAIEVEPPGASEPGDAIDPR